MLVISLTVVLRIPKFRKKAMKFLGITMELLIYRARTNISYRYISLVIRLLCKTSG